MDITITTDDTSTRAPRRKRKPIASFRLRRLAVKAHRGNRSHAIKWLRSIERLGDRWVCSHPLQRPATPPPTHHQPARMK